MPKPFNIDLLRSWIGRAVVVRFIDPESDWRYFRLEVVEVDGTICLTGMTAEDGTPHTGDWLKVNLTDIKSIRLRT